MSPPVIVVVHGACQPSPVYVPLVKALQNQGFPVENLDYPSTGPTKKMTDFTEDVEAIRETVTRLSDDGKEIIMLFHSYGGLPGSAAMRGLGKAERARSGKKGGVSRLLYVTSFAFKEGEAQSAKGDYETIQAYGLWDKEFDTALISKEAALMTSFQDMDNADGEHYYAMWKPQSIAAMWSEQTYAAWKDIPSAYVQCKNDRVIPLEYQQRMIANAREIEPSAFDVVETLDCGHNPVLSNIEDLVKIVKTLA